MTFEVAMCLISITLWINLMNWRKILFARAIWHLGFEMAIPIFCIGFVSEDGFDKNFRRQKFESLSSKLIGEDAKAVVELIGMPKYRERIPTRSAEESWIYDTGYGVVFRNDVCIEKFEIHTFH